MRDLGKGVVLVIVGLGPWLMLFALVGAPVWWWLRRRRPAPGSAG